MSIYYGNNPEENGSTAKNISRIIFKIMVFLILSPIYFCVLPIIFLGWLDDRLDADLNIFEMYAVGMILEIGWVIALIYFGEMILKHIG